MKRTIGVVDVSLLTDALTHARSGEAADLLIESKADICLIGDGGGEPDKTLTIFHDLAAYAENIACLQRLLERPDTAAVIKQRNVLTIQHESQTPYEVAVRARNYLAQRCFSHSTRLWRTKRYQNSNNNDNDQKACVKKPFVCGRIGRSIIMGKTACLSHNLCTS